MKLRSIDHGTGTSHKITTIYNHFSTNTIFLVVVNRSIKQTKKHAPEPNAVKKQSISLLLNYFLDEPSRVKFAIVLKMPPAMQNGTSTATNFTNRIPVQLQPWLWKTNDFYLIFVFGQQESISKISCQCPILFATKIIEVLGCVYTMETTFSLAQFIYI